MYVTYLCMYVCMICIYVCMHALMYVCMYVCVCVRALGECSSKACMYGCKYICMCMNMCGAPTRPYVHASMHTYIQGHILSVFIARHLEKPLHRRCTSSCVCVHENIYIYTCIHAHINTYIHTYIYKHIHTYIHTYILLFCMKGTSVSPPRQALISRHLQLLSRQRSS